MKKNAEFYKKSKVDVDAAGLVLRPPSALLAVCGGRFQKPPTRNLAGIIFAPVGRSIDSGARVGALVAHCEFSAPPRSDQSKLSVRPCKIRQKSGSAPMVEIV